MRCQKGLHMEGRMIFRVPIRRPMGACESGLATSRHALDSCRTLQMVGACIDCKRGTCISLHRAGMQAGLCCTVGAQVRCLYRVTWLHNTGWQKQRKPVGVPQPVLRVNAQHHFAGLGGLTDVSPLLKRIPRWAIKWVQRQSLVHLRECIAYKSTPAVQRVGHSIRIKLR